MRPSDQERAKGIESSLVAFDAEVKALPGIENARSRSVLVGQIVDSLRRIEFAYFVRDSRVNADRADPKNAIFDPIRAAVFYMRRGDFDEAIWLIFLSTHFGKHSADGWRLMRDIYGSLGQEVWSWKRVSEDPKKFSDWLARNERKLSSDGISRRFSNHRKYETLKSSSRAGTGAVIESYVNWIAPPRSHSLLIREVQKEIGQNPKDVFGYLYSSMKAVKRFGRLGKFDFLTMLGKLGLAPIEPDSAYLSEATGPLRGARLLFGGDIEAPLSAKELEILLKSLDSKLSLGMQVLEDSLCNWQKSPQKFVSFRG